MPTNSAGQRRRSGRSKSDGARMAEIMNTAAVIFRRKGYSETTIQDIADEVGILKGSLYHYIDTKEDLLHAIVERMAQQAEFLAEQAESGLATGDVLGTIESLIRQHVMLEVSRPVESAVFYRDGRHVRGALRDRLRAVIGRYEDTWTELLALGQREGLIRPELEARTAALTLLGTLNSIHLWHSPSASEAQVAKIPEVVITLLVRGLAKT